MKIPGKIILFLLGGILVAALALTIWFVSVTYHLKIDPSALSLSEQRVTVYDIRGEECDFPLQNRRYIPLDKMPSSLTDAFLSVEDKRFYRHNGVDFYALCRASVKNILTFSFREGASTISQQLIKNTHLSGEKTITRKMKEFKLTRLLERNYSKGEILELYLNSIYFGHGNYGVENASAYYFGKSAGELTLAESATLAALVKAPSHYSPFEHAENCKARRNTVLALMKEQDKISPAQYERAIGEALPDSPCENKKEGAYAKLLFAELSEIGRFSAGDMANMEIDTGYDPQLQSYLEEETAGLVGGGLVVDHASDLVAAAVGTTPRRSPASTVKPLLVYAPAMEENLISPATPVLDAKIDFGGYSPKNYGGKFNGYMSARRALAESVNIPAVKILNALTPQKAKGYADKMGLPLEEEDLNLALALGGVKNGFTLKELCDAYSTFAKGGSFSPSRTIREIRLCGKTIYRRKAKQTKVFSEDVAFLTSDMLKTAAKEGTAKKLSSLPFPVCAKTGTGGNDKGENVNAYCISYTGSHTAGVWMGNEDNSPIQATGGGIPTDMIKRFYQKAYSRSKPKPLPSSRQVKEVAFDAESYESEHKILLADEDAPPFTVKRELFRACALPKEKSTRFSYPTIQTPKLTLRNNTVCIELCQTYYYSYTIYREEKGKKTLIYEGGYQSKIYDGSLSPSVSYTYTVLPSYKNKKGKPVTLPSVCIPKPQTQPDNWWED